MYNNNSTIMIICIDQLIKWYENLIRHLTITSIMWFFLCCMFSFSSNGNDSYLNTQSHLQCSLSYMCSSFLQERFLCMLHALSSHHYWWHTSQFLKKKYNIYNSLEERFIILKYLHYGDVKYFIITLTFNFFNFISLQPV